MSASAVAFVPAAPLLIPAVAGGSALLDAELRAASLDVVARALAAAPGAVVVAASGVAEWSADATWDFSGFGPRRDPAEARPRLPWGLGIGAWLLDECGWNGPRRYVGVDLAADPSGDAARPAVSDGSAIVVVGDGSACRSDRAPGHFDERAEPFDRAVADLLARGDAAGLSGVDRDLAADLLCDSHAAWRWLATALEGSVPAAAELVWDDAPYGVGYFVALWSMV